MSNTGTIIRNRTIGYILLLVLILCTLPVNGETTSMQNCILISWDGISKDTLASLLEEDQVHALSEITQSGSFINISITDHSPDTMAGHAQILTGYPPEMTGVFKTMRYAEIPDGYTIFERAEDSLGPDNISTAIIASHERSLGSLKGLPFYHAGKIVDYYYDRNSDAGLVGSVAAEAVYHFAPKGRFLIFAHFKDADDAGYAYGAESPEQTDAIIRNDLATGVIMKALDETGTRENTLVIITTDHGFNTGPRDLTGEIEVWLAASEPRFNMSGDQKDITPTILHSLGISLDSIFPEYPGTILSQ